jgi:hypothetical protein
MHNAPEEFANAVIQLISHPIMGDALTTNGRSLQSIL